MRISRWLREAVHKRLMKQRALCRWSAEGISVRGRFAADAMLIKAELSAINLEEFFLRVPVLPFAAHAIVEDARVDFAAARFADSIQDTISFGRKFFAQPLFEVRSHTARQAQHVRSEERRVGKECRSRWSPQDEKINERSC